MSRTSTIDPPEPDPDERDPEGEIGQLTARVASYPKDATSRARLRELVRRQHREQPQRGARGLAIRWANRVTTTVLIGWSLLTKRWDAVIVACERALRGDPYSERLLYVLANAAINAGYRATAIATYEDILRRNPRGIPAMWELSHLYECEDDDLALAMARRVVEIQPNHAEAEDRVRYLVQRRDGSTYGRGWVRRSREAHSPHRDAGADRDGNRSP